MIDITGKNSEPLKKKRLYLLDMDGTIYNENQIFDGTLEFLEEIKRRGGEYIFITNNSSKSVEDYVKKVRDMGIQADVENFYTSSQATAMYLQENYPGQVVYCMGTRSLVEELRGEGIEVVTEPDHRATVVLIGFDTENTSEKIRNTCIMLGRDVAYLATNPDLVCPVSFGYIPDCGSMSIMLKNATGKEPFFIGKPEPIMVNCVLKKQNRRPEEAVIVGDRLYTDIKTGVNAKVDTICVLSGEATMEDIREGEVKPDYIFQSVKEIYQGLAEEDVD
ncbi:MAG TPA: HAD-IIA family hydrolase [Candidatus Blautia pullicola]|jgi:4-nitrophenyl phosphatase|uniref:Acid sugar phosphatase n=1 Tax=Candidatus Blautia pullicola TaxID=2838498 RepID=A0A9D2FNA2_9FIRM|nr:HAD-IIA family hydrolase [Candidatus Blautia pullicola]